MSVPIFCYHREFCCIHSISLAPCVGLDLFTIWLWLGLRWAFSFPTMSVNETLSGLGASSSQSSGTGEVVCPHGKLLL
jgi:hypothetical protein